MKYGWAWVMILGMAVAGVSGRQLERMSESRESSASLLYLPNGKHLKVASLGQSSLLADLIYIWAIQYYANYDREDRQRYVEHVFKDVIAELDPHYIDAYWLGALILTVESHDLEGGLRLLDLGFENNPDAWVLPYLAGWECHYAHEFERAAEYFRRASTVQDAPPMVRRLVGGMERRAGKTEQALREWQEILDDPRSDPASVAIAERQVRDLRISVDIELLTRSIERFRERNSRGPRTLAELVSGGYIDRVPLDPDGQSYVYDARTDAVTSAASRILGDR